MSDNLGSYLPGKDIQKVFYQKSFKHLKYARRNLTISASIIVLPRLVR